MNKAALKAKITAALRKGIKASTTELHNLIPASLTAGKIYEAYVLGLVCQQLRSKEGLKLTLIGSKRVTLKSSPGPINQNYPHIRVTKDNQHVANIWTDIEFTALSAAHAATSASSYGQYHEADIAVVAINCHSRPYPTEVHLLVECKNTGYQKNLLREILGIRRELSFLAHPQATFFSTWPRPQVPAEPPACICVYSTDPSVSNYSAPGQFFGIDFYHQPI